MTASNGFECGRLVAEGVQPDLYRVIKNSFGVVSLPNIFLMSVSLFS
jgi:hypothetical protein